MARWWMLSVLLFSATAAAHDVPEATPAQLAARALSRYPAGEVPSNRGAMRALITIGEMGTVAEVPLLIHLMRHESKAVGSVSLHALVRVRTHASPEDLRAIDAELAEWPKVDAAVRRLGLDDTVALSEP